MDTVSGATITTAGVKQAVDDALAQAADAPADQAKSGN
ncbi:FMN-binding protein [Senegalimassilia anaerobia]